MGLFDHIKVAIYNKRTAANASTVHTAMRDATVRSFIALLTAKLTKYDRQESKREMKRGIPTNIYRLAHLFGASEKVEADMKPYMKRDDPEAMKELRKSLGKHFTEGFRPIKAVLKALDAWEVGGKIPKYGSDTQVLSFRSDSTMEMLKKERWPPYIEVRYTNNGVSFTGGIWRWFVDKWLEPSEGKFLVYKSKAAEAYTPTPSMKMTLQELKRDLAKEARSASAAVRSPFADIHVAFDLDHALEAAVGSPFADIDVAFEESQ